MTLQVRCLSLSPKFNTLQQPGCFKTFESPLTQVHGVPSRNYSIKCQLTLIEGIISNRNKKTLNKLYRPPPPLALQDSDASTSEDDSKAANSSFLEVFNKKLNGVIHLTRPYAWISCIVGITSVCFLPLRSLSQVTPTFLMGVLKAIVPTIMMNIFMSSVNQIFDVEIDKINKPYLPLASGDLSMATGIAICAGSALLSIALGVMLGSPAVLWAVILLGVTGAAYSVPLPFLRWKSHTFLAPFTFVIIGLSIHIPFFIHSQKYLLGEPFVVTGPLIFATTIMSIIVFVSGLIKDLPDVEGDKAFGMQTLCVLLGKEKVLQLCVNMMLLGYGGAVIAGAFASSSSMTMTSKLVTITGHSILAFWMWFRSQKVDLDKFESTFGFYIFIWKLNYIEYILIHFLR